MNRKLINIIVIFIIMQGMFLFCNICEANNEKASFSVSSNVGKVGEEVTIEINLNSNSNFSSANLVLNYNTEHLEYVSHLEGDVLKTGAMSIVKNNSETGKIAIGYIGDPSNTEITIKPGNILKVVFKIKSNMDGATNLELECTSLKNDSGNDIINTISNGKIEKETTSAGNENNNDSTGNENNNDSTGNENNNDSTGNENNNDSTGNENNNDSPENENNNDSTGNENNYNTTGNGSNNSTENKKDTTTSNTEAENQFPHAGLYEKAQFIIISIILISISIVLYKKNEFMREIK